MYVHFNVCQISVVGAVPLFLSLVLFFDVLLYELTFLDPVRHAGRLPPVQPGDVVSVEVEGLGTLTNTIVEGPVPVSDEIGAQPTETEEVLSTALGAEWEFRGQRRPNATDRSELPFPRVRPKMQS